MAQEQLTREMATAAFDRLATARRRTMFLSGRCFGAALTGLACLTASGALRVLLALEVVWIAWRGWPWEA